MKKIGMFRRYTPEPAPEIKAAYFKNGDNVDWYSIVHDSERTQDTIYIGTNESGQIVDIAHDGSSMHPEGKVVYEIPSIDFPNWVLDKSRYTSIMDNDFLFDHERFNTDIQYRYISKARAFSQDWRTELELGIISDEDKDHLKEVMLYIQELRGVNVTQTEPAWPSKPTFMN